MDIQEAVRRLRTFYRTRKRLPSYAEMADLFQYASKNASFHLVKKLIERGIIEKDNEGKLIPKHLFSIPHLGIIHAGSPTEAFVTDDNLDLYNFILNISPDTFSLTIKGDSMRDEGINEGDIVIVDKNKPVKNGDIVAACVDNEWTVKYFHKKGGQITLVPANKNYPIIQPNQSLEIGGVVIHVIRSYR
jgi:SOS regulatory protein LexA